MINRGLIFFMMILMQLAISQTRFEISGQGFSFEEPFGWYKIEGKEKRENVKKFQWTDEQLKDLANRKSLKIISLHKYDPDNYRGIIPTINLTVRTNTAKNFEVLRKSIIGTYKQSATLFENFKLLSGPAEVLIDSKKVFVCTASYTITKPEGEKADLFVKMIYLINGKYLYDIVFVEEKGVEDNVNIFDALIKSVKLETEEKKSK